jgi:GTPase SAR1 family protein
MQGFIIVYDVNDRNSFEHLNDYLNWIQQYGKQHEVKVIVGNKLDDSSNRAVTVDEAKVFHV